MTRYFLLLSTLRKLMVWRRRIGSSEKKMILRKIIFFWQHQSNRRGHAVRREKKSSLITDSFWMKKSCSIICKQASFFSKLSRQWKMIFFGRKTPVGEKCWLGWLARRRLLQFSRPLSDWKRPVSPSKQIPPLYLQFTQALSFTVILWDSKNKYAAFSSISLQLKCDSDKIPSF